MNEVNRCELSCDLVFDLSQYCQSKIISLSQQSNIIMQNYVIRKSSIYQGIIDNGLDDLHGGDQRNAAAKEAGHGRAKTGEDDLLVDSPDDGHLEFE